MFRRMPCGSSPVLIRQSLPSRRLSARTVRNRLKSAGRKSRRVIKRSMLLDRYQRLRLAWYLVWRSLNLRTWRRIHMSNESWFLLHVTDGRMRVWRRKNTAYTPRNIQLTVPYGGGSVMIWVCISHDCKLDLVTIRENLTGDQLVHQRCLTTSCSPFRKAHTTCKICVYRWQRRAASFRGSPRLSSKWSRDFFSIASNEPGFESNRACLGHARPSCTRSWTSCATIRSIGSSIASGMADDTTTAHPTTD